MSVSPAIRAKNPRIRSQENQRILYEEIREYFEYLYSPEVTEIPEDQRESELEKDHGRIEKRRIRRATDNEFVRGKKKFNDLKTIIEYRSHRRIRESTTVTVG